MSPIPKPLISVSELSANIDHPQLVLLDASWYLPAMGRDGIAEWKAQRIGDARHFDFHHDACDTTSPYPHTMPNADHFTQCAQALGINQDSHIVVYDGMGMFSSPRVWWMFKAMGHENISILDGGLPAWFAAGLPTTKSEPSTPEVGNFIAQPDESRFTSTETILSELQSDDHLVIDVRSEGRFAGHEPEPREGMRSGHIPNSVNLPFTQVVDNGFLKPEAELKGLMSQINASDKALIFTCGSGVTACHLALAAEVCGYTKLSIYDGSWSEWGIRHELPISTS